MAQTELKAVNSLLTAIGDSPANELDNNNPDIATARVILSTNNEDMQSTGWWFNQETWDMVRDTENKIPVPVNTLFINTSNSNWIKRGNYIYDLENHTYDFTDIDITDKTYTATLLLNFNELPNVVYNYIVNVSKIQFLIELETEVNKTKVIEKLASNQFLQIQKLQMKFSRPSKLNTPMVRKLFKNVQLKRINT